MALHRLDALDQVFVGLPELLGADLSPVDVQLSGEGHQQWLGPLQHVFPDFLQHEQARSAKRSLERAREAYRLPAPQPEPVGPGVCLAMPCVLMRWESLAAS